MSTNDSVTISRSCNDNLTRLYLGDNITIWFSYETPVAFAISGEGRFKSENIWSRATQRHLDSIPGHELKREEFKKRLARLMGKIGTATNRITPRTK